MSSHLEDCFLASLVLHTDRDGLLALTLSLHSFSRHSYCSCVRGRSRTIQRVVGQLPLSGGQCVVLRQKTSTQAPKEERTSNHLPRMHSWAPVPLAQSSPHYTYRVNDLSSYEAPSGISPPTRMSITRSETSGQAKPDFLWSPQRAFWPCQATSLARHRTQSSGAHPSLGDGALACRH